MAPAHGAAPHTAGQGSRVCGSCRVCCVAVLLGSLRCALRCRALHDLSHTCPGPASGPRPPSLRSRAHARRRAAGNPFCAATIVTPHGTNVFLPPREGSACATDPNKKRLPGVRGRKKTVTRLALAEVSLVPARFIVRATLSAHLTPRQRVPHLLHRLLDTALETLSLRSHAASRRGSALLQRLILLS